MWDSVDKLGAKSTMCHSILSWLSGPYLRYLEMTIIRFSIKSPNRQYDIDGVRDISLTFTLLPLI